MYCPTCGNELKEDELFCTKCGSKVEEIEVAEGVSSELVKKKKSKKVVFGVIALVLVCGVAALLLVGSHKKENSVLPYGIEWGDTYEQVSEKDTSLMGEFHKADGKYADVGFWDMSCYGGEKTEEQMAAFYMFGETKDSGLTSVSIIALDDFNENEVKQIVEYYSQMTNKEPECLESESETFWTWKTDKVEIIIQKVYGVFVVDLKSMATEE